MMRVAVFGASGFVGATLVERAASWEGCEVRPIIHGTGNAARLARHGTELWTADLLAPDTTRRALEGCTHVVNCSRGPGETMTTGLQNLLDASASAGIRRFVHLSSVAVYGDAHRGVIDESAPARPATGSYGAMKLAQDERVVRAAGRGLSSVILCPPNISGPYSAFLLEIVRSIERRDFALVDDGGLPCELVDVENLVHAIRLALTAPDSEAERTFVTDGGGLDWGRLAAGLAALGDHDLPLPAVSLEQASALTREVPAPPPSLRRAARHLLSSGVREILRKDPWFAGYEKRLKDLVRTLPGGMSKGLRSAADGGRPAATARSARAYSDRLLKQQLRDVRYSGDRAGRLLGYKPVVTFEQSMFAFRAWYEATAGWNDEWWPLTRHLDR